MVSAAAADTIVAIATASGRGAIGVVRVSGAHVQSVMRHVCGRDLAARVATHLSFRDSQGEPIDDGLAIFFPAPHSYTGEDVLELQGHGGPGVLSLVVQSALGAPTDGGARLRLAEPGEFTQRAFLNDKLDLAQAEAVADLIDAGSERAARSALASLQGRFSRLIEELLAAMIDLRMRVEACLDFPEEDIEFIAKEGVEKKLTQITQTLEDIFQSATRGAALREGLSVVLAGPPNVGKSSLMNALAEQDVALVTDIAGTTRDRIVQEILIEGVPIHVIDTAGLRATEDAVEKMGIERTWQEIERAQLILFLRDASGLTQADPELEAQIIARAKGARHVIRVVNKSDLLKHGDSIGIASEGAAVGGEKEIYVSAKTGLGLEALKKMLLAEAGYSIDASAGVFSARTRHLDALRRSREHLNAAFAHLRAKELELLAECLRLSQDALSEITGAFSSDDLLGRIFSRFCIGK